MFERQLTVHGASGTYHEVSQVMHERATGQTWVMCDHWDEGGERMSTVHAMPLDWSVDFDKAEEWLLTLPEYAEAEPEQTLVERMRAMLTAEQLAELGLEG